MARLGRMHEKCRCAGTRKCGRNLAGDMSRLSDATDDDSAFAGEDDFYGANEIYIKPVGQPEYCPRFHLEHAPSGLQRLSRVEFSEKCHQQ